MYWKDEGYLLSKINYDENSIIIEAFTLEHGKYTGIIYGGSSRKQRRNFQIGNKILLNWRSKGQNKSGYFNTELIKPISPYFFEDKKRSIAILSATTILKILLPEGQINKKIYAAFEDFLNKLHFDNWIVIYISWELSLIKELGFESTFINRKTINDTVIINDKIYKIPKVVLNNNFEKLSANDIKEALIFNKALIIENFISPNKLKFPLSRMTLEKYYFK